MKTNAALGLWACCLLMLLAGCNFTLPRISSATVEQYQAGRLLRTTGLSPDQVRALSTWFSEHDSAWSPSAVTYAPNLLLRAKHANGDTSVINIMTGMVVVYNRSGQFQQQLSNSDFASVQRILVAQ